MQRKSKKGQYNLTRKFDGHFYSIYAAQKYNSKTDANRVAVNLRKQGYKSRVVSSYGKWLVYFKR
jgi:hypothetical protein